MSNLAIGFAIVARICRANYWQVWVIVAAGDSAAAFAKSAQLEALNSALQLLAVAMARRAELGVL